MQIERASLVLMLLVLPSIAPAQSLLDRPPNLSANWVGNSGTLYFHFLHRFVAGDAPQRKVSSVPTFLVGAGLPKRLLGGFNYSTNSTLAAGFPNEWEAFLRWNPIVEKQGRWLDVGGQVAYNNAARGVDYELSVARRAGKMRVVGAGRVLSDPVANGAVLAIAGGAVLRLNTHIAVGADVATLTERRANEQVAWSAGVHIAIPLTPHTFSLQATNTPVTTLQGMSRGTKDVRYGFEFTIPLTLPRYFGRRSSASLQDTARTVRTGMRNIAYNHTRIEITTGTTVIWTNSDAMPHSVTSADRAFDSGMIEAGKSWQYTFTKAGTYNFYCVPHPFMKGTVAVRDQ